ncbi:MAG: sulfite exporter TauE/SafE family protein [Treponema sp.]|jgi:sulfite exporter TauE/SafE/copper chaperone CopZ|nr:sulfite exporter TauE/SafE family protein [Treponema sp.]
METETGDAVHEELVLSVGGMFCANCQSRIAKKLKEAAGVTSAEVSYRTGKAVIVHDPGRVSGERLRALVEELGYRVQDGGREAPSSGREPWKAALGTAIIILALYALLRQFGALVPAFPLAGAGMGYGMLFVIGLVTSVHCVAMCGGINLSQCMPGAAGVWGRSPQERGGAENRRFAAGGETSPRAGILLPAVLYNGGRIISYTLAGALVGALGSVITMPLRMQGFVQLAAGAFMVIMGINMLGIFPGLRRFGFHLPRSFTRKIGEKREAGGNPFVVGLLNGLMPCGPLQAMQLYALSTASPARGALSMFLFCLGTVPLMFFVGALSSVLSGKFSARAVRVGAVLVTVLGLTMFSNGWNLGGFPLPFGGLSAGVLSAGPLSGPAGRGKASAADPVVRDGVQIVNSTLSGGRYPAITVREGMPVRWIINAPQGSINGCNNRMIIREYGIEHRFTVGENVIEFTPGRAGRIPYSCWMGMIRSSITVLAADGPPAGMEADLPDDTAPQPAGVVIPSESAAVAGIDGGTGLQKVGIDLRDDGFSPSIVVVQRGVRTEWTINNDSLDQGNSVLVFPAYYARVPVENGDNVIDLLPASDFEFYTVDGVYFGYVKVVDDLEGLDIEAVKAEAAARETLIYPDAFFDTAGRNGG